MNESSGAPDQVEQTRIPWYRQRLLLLVSGSIVVALLLVMAAMALYTSSGSAQLDLSRPGYQAVQDKVEPGTFESFPSSGPVSEKVLNDFLELYDKQTHRVDSDTAFSVEPLEDTALGIDAPKPGE